MILIDTSVWVDYLRDVDSRAATTLWNLLADDAHICTTGIVVAEILSGQKNATLRRKIERDLEGLTSLPAEDPADYIATANAYQDCRSAGITVSGLTDCLIAVVAARHNAILFHKDRDFEAIKKVLPRLRTMTE